MILCPYGGSQVKPTMAYVGSMRLPRDFGIYESHRCVNLYINGTGKTRVPLVGINLSSHGSRQDAWNLQLLNSVRGQVNPASSRCNVFLCRSVLVPGGENGTSILKSAAVILTRSCDALRGRPFILKLIPAVCVFAFAAWGIGPVMRLGSRLFFHRTDNSWKKSNTHHIMSSYLQPLLLWTGATLICRALDLVVLPSEVSQALKQRVLNFVRSLSTILAFAYCLSSLIQQVQKFFTETNESNDARNMGFDFAGKAVYTAVWVAALSLFMELLGFSTQKWLTAGGLGTVLLTLAGREIFTNFLSSVMIHATRPFVLNEWIQTKIQGYEVSGTVEHVGWWSPTIIRGDDREAVHIPNHKFTVNVVRNLSQKSHWRIKTHLAISHLDVNKINNIVADMRKVLAKNPQVEQQRLHRRVFLDNVDPENQALMILVSCFVKTSRFEEYLCVKEAILLDLLRVVSHHRARLATPIRTVQKIYSEADLENVPFADSIFTQSRGTTNRPLLLIEPSYKINGEDKAKASIRSVRTSEEKVAKQEAWPISDAKSSEKNEPTSNADSKTDDRVMAKSTGHSGESIKIPLTGNSISDAPEQDQPEIPVKRNQVTGNEEIIGLKSKDTTPRAKISEKPSSSFSESGGVKTDMQMKQDGEKAIATQSMPRPPLEENILLGVALEGSKRTLPIEEEMAPSPSTESKELSTHRNGCEFPPVNKDIKDGPMPAVPNVSQND